MRSRPALEHVSAREPDAKRKPSLRTEAGKIPGKGFFKVPSRCPVLESGLIAWNLWICPGTEAFEQVDDRPITVLDRYVEGCPASGIRDIHIRAEIDQMLGQQAPPIADGDMQRGSTGPILGRDGSATFGQERQGVPIIHTGPDQSEQEHLPIIRRARHEEPIGQVLPSVKAIRSEVSPARLVAFGSAPFFSSSRATMRRPRRAAAWRDHSPREPA